MLSEYFDSAARVSALRAGPAGGLIEQFAGALSQGGYAEITARRHLRAAEHFVYWTNRNGISLHSLSEQALSQFACHLPRCRCPHYGHADRSLLHGARLFLKHLEKTGIVDVVADASSTPEPAILTAFCQWMRQQRGTCEKTLCHYRSHIRELLNRLGEAPQAFDARSLREFVIEGSQGCGWAVAKKRTTALRMFLRFLIAEGKCAPGLFSLTGGCHRCRVTCNLKRSSGSSPPAIRHHPLASVIGRSCCFWLGWGYGPATSSRCGSRTSTGQRAGFGCAAKVIGWRACRSPRKWGKL